MLKDRPNLLKMLEKDLTDAACLKITLNDQGRYVFLTDSNNSNIISNSSDPYFAEVRQRSRSIWDNWSAGGSCSPPTPQHHQQQDDVFSNMKTFRCHGELSPQNSLSGGSGSTSSAENSEILTSLSSTTKKNSFLEPGSGMKDVPVWLKGLRLHKYSPLFATMTYDEMMNLTEEQLEIQGVTKGARHKIVLNIQKLKDRPNLLRQLEKDLVDVACLKSVLNELKLMICTPVRAYFNLENHQNNADEDVFCGQIVDANLPSLFGRVLLNACVQLINVKHVGIDEDCFSLASNVLDRCLNHEAFSSGHKKRFLTMKQQVRRIWNPSSMPRKLGPRSNSWNKDRRPQYQHQQLGACSSSSSSQTISPSSSSLLGLQQHQNGLSSSSRHHHNQQTHFAGRNSNGLLPANMTSSKPANRVEVNGCFVPPTAAYHHGNNCSGVFNAPPSGQQGRNVFLSDSSPEAYNVEVRGNHPAVQRTISAPAFRQMTSDPCSLMLHNTNNNNSLPNGSPSGAAVVAHHQQQITPPVLSTQNPQQNNNNYSFFAHQPKSVDLATIRNNCNNNLNSYSMSNGWSSSRDAADSSLFSSPSNSASAQNSKLFRQQQCSPFQNRSGWSCGFEDGFVSSMTSSGYSPFVGVGCGAIGPIGTPRSANSATLGLVQFSTNRRGNITNGNGTCASSSPLLSANGGCHQNLSTSSNFVFNDNTNVNAAWNFDQLCRRVMEAAIDSGDKPGINGF